MNNSMRLARAKKIFEYTTELAACLDGFKFRNQANSLKILWCGNVVSNDMNHDNEDEIYDNTDKLLDDTIVNYGLEKHFWKKFPAKLLNKNNNLRSKK